MLKKKGWIAALILNTNTQLVFSIAQQFPFATPSWGCPTVKYVFPANRLCDCMHTSQFVLSQFVLVRDFTNIIINTANECPHLKLTLMSVIKLMNDFKNKSNKCLSWGKAPLNSSLSNIPTYCGYICSLLRL